MERTYLSKKSQYLCCIMKLDMKYKEMLQCRTLAINGMIIKTEFRKIKKQYITLTEIFLINTGTFNEGYDIF